MPRREARAMPMRAMGSSSLEGRGWVWGVGIWVVVVAGVTGWEAGNASTTIATDGLTSAMAEAAAARECVLPWWRVRRRLGVVWENIFLVSFFFTAWGRGEAWEVGRDGREGNGDVTVVVVEVC